MQPLVPFISNLIHDSVLSLLMQGLRQPGFSEELGKQLSWWVTVGSMRVLGLYIYTFGGDCVPSPPTIAPIHGLWCELHPICHSRYEEGSNKPRVSHPSSPNPCAQPVDIYADIRTSLYLTCACGMLVGGDVAISVGRGVICAPRDPCMHPPMYHHPCLHCLS